MTHCRPAPKSSVTTRRMTAVLRSLIVMLERGPLDEPQRFFDVVRAMLFYTRVSERLHHPKDQTCCFPSRACRPGDPVIDGWRWTICKASQGAGLQHLLLAGS